MPMSRIIYKGFYIDKTVHGYRVCFLSDPDKHTHLKNLRPSYRLIDNVVSKRIPRRCGFYYLESHARLSDDEKYIQKINDYIATKQNKGKKQYYYNPSRKYAGGIFK